MATATGSMGRAESMGCCCGRVGRRGEGVLAREGDDGGWNKWRVICGKVWQARPRFAASQTPARLLGSLSGPLPPHWLTLASSTEPTARLIAAHIALASHWHAHLLHPHPPALSKSCTRRHLGSHTPSPNGTPSAEYSCFLLSFLKSSLAQHAQHTLKPYPHLLSLHPTLQTFFVFYQAPRASLVNFIH